MTFLPVLPEGVNIEDLLDRLRYFSWGAADILIAYSKGDKPPYGFSKALDVQEGGEGPVSAADLAVNQWIMDGLRESFPSANWKLVSEETSKDIDVKEFLINKEEWVWILDPLDGTKDFLQGNGEYAVHLALIKNQTPQLGVVLIPEKEELWIGIVGKGAWCENRISEKKFASFSQRKDLKDLILVASRNHRDANLEKLLSYIGFGESKSIGSVGCKIASILRGDSDVYISLSGESAPKHWDMAAPEAVLKAAGGEFTHADQKGLIYNNESFEQRGCLLASHGLNHSLICNKAMEGMSTIDSKFEV